MGREIKFRGKRVDNGEWVYFNQYGTYVDKNGNEISPKRFTRDCGYEIIPETVGQYAGLKDKNVKEIYKGDILKNDKTGEIGFVAWHGTMAGFILNKLPRNSTHGKSFDWGELFQSCMKRKVIGNIYDNPELLEGPTPCQKDI